jgi:hypothetical protein
MRTDDLRKSPLLAQRTREKWGTHRLYFFGRDSGGTNPDKR